MRLWAKLTIPHVIDLLLIKAVVLFLVESPCRASRVVSPSGEELPPHNAWGGSNAGLDMEAFGPSGTVVFRNHAFPLGDTPKEEAKAPPAGR